MDLNHETRLFFLHLPKAAGTTFKDILYRQYAFPEIAWIDGSYHEESIERLIGLDAKRRNSFRCVMGHFQYGLHEYFDGEYKYVTFLRDPIARTVSTYYHILRNSLHHKYHQAIKQGKLGLETFVRQRLSDETSNLQVRWISGESVANASSLALAKENIERDFAFAGISEEFDRSLVMYAHMVGSDTPLHYARKNEGVYKQEPLEPHVVDLIAEENSYDLELYDWVRSRFFSLNDVSRALYDEGVESLIAANAKYNRNRTRLGFFYRCYEAYFWKKLQRDNPLLIRNSCRQSSP